MFHNAEVSLRQIMLNFLNNNSEKVIFSLHLKFKSIVQTLQWIVLLHNKTEIDL